MPKQASPGQEKVILLVVGVLFFLGGMGALYYGVNSIIKVNDIKKWPTVKGVVTYSKSRTQSPRSGGGTSTFIADIKYRYKVNNFRYTNDCVSLGQYGTSNRKHVREELRKYPVNQNVTVYYNPDNPQDAVLEPIWGWINAIPLAIGIVISIISVLMIWKGIMKKHK